MDIGAHRVMPIANSADQVRAWLEANGFDVDAIDDVEVAPAETGPRATASPSPVVACAPKPRRHAWVRLREHVYLCRHCGTGKEHVHRGSEWFTRWHLPTGRSERLKVTPPCEPGPNTARALAKYAAVIAAGGVKKDRET